jgi:hypothetical protein
MAVPDSDEASSELLRNVDVGLPAATLVLPENTAFQPGEIPDEQRLPLITESFLREATAGILRRFGSAFGAAWHADPERLRSEAVALLVRFGAVIVVPGGVLARPLIGRYRNTVAEVKQRTLF